MGDRANFGFKNKTDGPTIFLYGHWAGQGMMGSLAYALYQAKPRWSDSEYATRITISNIIGNDWTAETGWGLSVDYLCDNEHSVPVVDWEAQTVSLYPATWNDVPKFDNPKFTMSLEGFTKKFLTVALHL